MKKNLLNLKMAMIGVGMLFTAALSASTFTATVSGNWSSAATWGGTAPGGTISGDAIIIPTGITVTMDMDVTYASGILITNAFNVDGILNGSSNTLMITQGAITGAGTVAVKRLTFSNTGTAAYTGTMNVGTLENEGATLALVAVANVSDSLVLGNGAINLNANASLMMNTGSTIRVDDGTLSLGGTGVFSSNASYNVLYMGTNKTAGLELTGTAIQNVWLNMDNNAQTVKLNGNFTVGGNLTINNGKMNLNGHNLTIMGDLNMNGSTNSFVSNSSSELSIMGTGNLTSGLNFDSGSSLNNLTINRSGSSVKLMSNLDIAGHLNLMNGSLSVENGATMKMNANSTIHLEGGSLTTSSGNFDGAASYNVEYMGSANTNSGIELTGSGLKDMTVNYGSATSKVTLNNDVAVTGALSLMMGMLDLNGKNLTLNGTMTQGTANAVFVGNANSDLMLNLTSTSNTWMYFDQTNNTIHKLKVNLGGTSSWVGVASALNIGSELNFTNGKLALGDNGDLMIASTGTITGYDASKYIVTTTSGSNTAGGRLQMNVASGSTDWMTFPVGTNDNYSPAYIQQNSAGTAGNFMVKATNELLADGTIGADNSATSPVVKRTWHIEAASGVNVNMNLKLGWTAAAEVNGFDHTNAMLRHYTSSAWDVTATTSATAGANGTWELSRSTIASLSPFAVTGANTTVGIKQNVANSANFDVYPNPAKDAISVKTAGASNCKYELIDITGRTLVSVFSSDAVNKFDLSKLEKGCYFVKMTDTTNNVTVTKRFVKD